MAIEGLIVTEEETKTLEDYLERLISKADVLKLLMQKNNFHICRCRLM